MGRKIAFVTGANGFVGSHLVELLLEKDMEVHCLMRHSSSDRWLKNRNVTIHREGIENPEYLRQVFSTYQANYVFHLAGTVKAFDYEGFEAGNVQTTRSILEAALNIPSIEKILVTSSLAASCPTRVGSPNTEACPRRPLTDYGRSKVAEEDLALGYMDRLPIAIIRPPVVYGERDVEVLLFFKTIKNHLMPLIGFHTKSISLVYVKDLVMGFYQCAVSGQSRGETYFLGGHRDEYTWPELGQLAGRIMNSFTIPVKIPHALVYSVALLFEIISKLSGVATAFNRQKAKEIVCESWSCTSQKAARDFGYQPKVSVEEGFKVTIDWYRKMEWL